MSEKERTIAEIMITTAPPGNINIGALAENVQRFTDAQLSTALSFVRELCNNEPVPESTVALVKAKRVFDRYWSKHRNRED
jgi:hypothetical protein